VPHASPTPVLLAKLCPLHLISTKGKRKRRVPTKNVTEFKRILGDDLA
jgi:hypothetical protein